MRRVYFDHSATTPVDERVVKVMSETMLRRYGNPSSIHNFGQEAKAVLDRARAQVARMLNADSSEVYFTSGGTEADNIAVIGGALKLSDKRDHVVVSSIEHPAVRAAADELERLGVKVTRVEADRFGTVTPEAIEAALTERTALVSVMHINNEVGTINDIAAIGRLVRTAGALFHTDAVQSFGKVAIDVKEMNIDLLSLSGHKIYGPKGVGALFIRDGVKVAPLSFGGHQESGVRAGTENLPGIAGLGEAAEICGYSMAGEAERVCALRDDLQSRLTEALDDITVNGHPSQRLPGNLSMTFNGVEGEALMIALDLKGIAVSTGSACSSGSTQPSKVLLAIGLTPLQAQSTLRFSLGRTNTHEDVDYAAEAIISAVNRLRKMAVSDAGFAD